MGGIKKIVYKDAYRDVSSLKLFKQANIKVKKYA